ncbi:MAG: helix-hairpin-helix domain-containing protein, partial [Planctomycetota bacterium]|nr:helix-hairpin-helix domain-containing protein [Planctomycetota bacterium]
QHLRPELRGKPVAVVPLEADTTSCIAASIQAKAFNVRTGTKVGEAKRLCPGLVLVKARPEEYVRHHHAVLAAIETVVPVDGVHSIDEASCRLLGPQRLESRAIELALGIKRAIAERVGETLTCSVGLAPNRFLAKVAADMRKPDGLTVLRLEELPGAVAHLKLTDFPGIGPKMAERLSGAGIRTTEDLLARSETELARAWGSVVGREWWHRLRGVDLHETKNRRRSIGHSHVLGPERREHDKARAVAFRLASKASSRARQLGYVAEHITLSISYLAEPGERRRGGGSGSSWKGAKWSERAPLGHAADTLAVVEALSKLWARAPVGRVLKLGVTLHDLVREGEAASLFAEQRHRAKLAGAIDKINRKFGSETLYSAAMHDARKTAPKRIAFGSIPEEDGRES